MSNQIVDLHYQAYNPTGTSEPVVLLHGLFGSSTNWGTIARQLASDYWVIALDLRNHGRSPHADDVSYAAMSRDIIALLDELEVRHACFVGHSMGGKLAMQLAMRYPQRVSSLAVVDMAPVAYQHTFNDIFAAFASVDLARIKSRADAREQMDDAQLGGDIKAFLLQNLQKDADTWRWRVNLVALAANQAEIIGYPDAGQATFPGKTWFIYGELSDYVLPDHHPAIFAAFPNARFCPVAQAGHWVYADQPEGFMQCLQTFLHH